MSFRLDQGHGRCLYRIGVEDDGCHSLLSYDSVAESARVVECIARTLNAIVVERIMIQNEINSNNSYVLVVSEPCILGDAMGKTQTMDTTNQQQLNKMDGVYTRAELFIQRIETHLLDPTPVSAMDYIANYNPNNNATTTTASIEQQVPPQGTTIGNTSSPTTQLGETLATRNIRVAVVGNVDAGKSTLIGTLTTSCLDDGRGKSRTSIMKHRHEIASGRTSTATTHMMGFNGKGQPIAGKDQVRANKRKGDDEIARESHRIVTLMDLAGHEKYLKTTYVSLNVCVCVCVLTELCTNVYCFFLYIFMVCYGQYSRRLVWICRLCSHSRQRTTPTNTHDTTSLASLLQFWHPCHCCVYQN
jgi:hypothetical protein